MATQLSAFSNYHLKSHFNVLMSPSIQSSISEIEFEHLNQDFFLNF